MRPRDICLAAGLSMTLGVWACSARPYVRSVVDGGE